jgi:amidase
VITQMSEFDIIVTPTITMPPCPIGWMFEEEDPWMQLFRAGQFIAFTALPNFSGLPAVSVPLHWSNDGLPIGVQIVGGPADEATLVRVSAQLERARPWADRRPPVS